MDCKYFGICGSCTLYNKSYKEQLQLKIDTIKKEFDLTELDVISSKESHFRNRAEFKIFHDKNGISYAMYTLEKKGFIKIGECKIVVKNIYDLMPKLLKKISKSEILKTKLFMVEFLSSNTNEILATLIYHKKIDKSWQKEAEKLADDLNIELIGRSKKVKIVVTKDTIFDSLKILDKEYKYTLHDSSFIQPNSFVNAKMISWVKSKLKKIDSDLLELYCGHGNFTLPLSEKFRKILATEISKTSIKLAKENSKINNIKNIDFVRLSSEELIMALNKQRVFKRLQDIDLDSYNFSYVFVDPPRAGVDKKTLEFIKKFKNIIYISCNPKTLKRDLALLHDNFKIKKFAIFDQFAYTYHVECGVILKQI